MKIVVIDGQGGGIGKSIIEALKKEVDAFVIAVGTNAVATSNMLKAGANVGATGENAVIYNASDADIIIGPIGIAFANSMYGEISKGISDAITSSPATKYLIPVSKCNVYIPGVAENTVSGYIQDCIEEIKNNKS